MSSISPNNNTGSQVSNETLTKLTKFVKGQRDEIVESWEFFKTTKGVLTDKINSMFNIPSSAFLPDFAVYTFNFLSDAVLMTSVLNQFLKKSKQLTSATNTDDIVKKSIGYQALNS